MALFYMQEPITLLFIAYCTNDIIWDIIILTLKLKIKFDLYVCSLLERFLYGIWIYRYLCKQDSTNNVLSEENLKGK